MNGRPIGLTDPEKSTVCLGHQSTKLMRQRLEKSLYRELRENGKISRITPGVFCVKNGLHLLVVLCDLGHYEASMMKETKKDFKASQLDA